MDSNDILTVVGQMEYLLIDSEDFQITYRLRNLIVFVEYHYDMICKNDRDILERILKLNETVVAEHTELFEESTRITDEYKRAIARLNKKIYGS